MHDEGDSRLFAHDVLPRAELDALLVRYRKHADRHGPSSKRALRLRNQIAESNMKLVYSTAKRYRAPRGWDDADLRAYGVLGLIKAIERFDPERGVAFSTYAVWWIRHAIGRSLADLGNVVRIPVHALAARSSPQANEDARAAQRVGSLDARIGVDDERSFVDMLQDDSDDPPSQYVDNETTRRVSDAIAQLPERHRVVVLARMEGLTLREAAERVRVSRPTAAILEGEAQALLRRALSTGERAA